MELNVNIEKVARREWVTIEQKVSILKKSTELDQITIEVRTEDVPVMRAGKLYIDNISIISNK